MQRTIRRCGSCGGRWKCRRRASGRQWAWKEEGQRKEVGYKSKRKEEDGTGVENKGSSGIEIEDIDDDVDDDDDEKKKKKKKKEEENGNGNGWTSSRTMEGRSSKDTGSACGQAVCSSGR